MNYPTYVLIDNERYDINTDFRIAIKCNEVAQDDTISDYERALAIVYLLFGDKGLKCKHRDKLLEYGIKFMLCGEEPTPGNSNEKPDMDYVEDYDYIVASFLSDFNIDLDTTNMHWYKFNKLMNGLSNSEMGNCCVLNRIRNLRNYDLKDITDPKERQKIKKAQEQVALKKNKVHLTKEQEESERLFFKQIRGGE